MSLKLDQDQGIKSKILPNDNWENGEGSSLEKKKKKNTH